MRDRLLVKVVRGIILGVVVFGDEVHITPLLVALQLVGVLALVVGVILVARAPVFRDLRLRELPHVALDLLQHPLPDDSAVGQAPDATGDPDTKEPQQPAEPVHPDGADRADQAPASEAAGVLGPPSRPASGAK